MKPRKRDVRYISVLSVWAPSAAALIDMLRYDRCCPLTEDESRKLWKLIGDERNGTNTTTPIDHCVRLMRFAAADQPATEGRWRSFGARVLDERNPEDVQLLDGELLNLAKVKTL